MDVKGAKDGIEGFPHVILGIADVIDSRVFTSPPLSNNIKVPNKLEGTFVLPLVHEDLVGRLLEVADQFLTMSRPRVGLEDIEYKENSSSRFLVPGGIHRNFMAISRWILLEQASRSIKLSFKDFHCSLSVLSVIVYIISSVSI